jgi:two-component system cell cycle sensor histidine kinase/response regulator CckA
MASVHPSATAVWPPSGIALAALLALGYRVWPGVLLGAFLVNMAVAGAEAPSLGIAVGNTLEGVLGAYLVNTYANGRDAFDRVRDFFKFVFLAGVASTAVSAVVGVSSLVLAGSAAGADSGRIALTWWLGDAVSVLVLAPLLLVWAGPPERWARPRGLEAAAALVSVFIVGEFVFGGLFFKAPDRPLTFACIPILVWAALRLGQRLAATAVFMLCVMAVRATAYGSGPFQGNQNESLLLLQAFIGVAAVMTMAVAAVVSEREAAAAALRRAHEDLETRIAERTAEYHSLFDRNPHPMLVFDDSTLAFLAVSEAAIRTYGYSREEFLGMTIKEIHPPEDLPELHRAMRERPADRRAISTVGLVRHRKKDGTLIEAEVSSSWIRFRGREARLVLALDVTEKRSLEAQLLQSQKMETVGRLAGGVAHDFNNLLGVITGYGQLLRNRLDDPRLLKYADDILKASERAAGLTQQLLAFSRKQVLQPRILDLNRVVGQFEGMLRRLIGEDIQLVISLVDVPPIKADQGQLEQVLMNLAVNARDAMPKGGQLVIETATVDLDESYARNHADVRPGPHVMLAVSDTGHGMTMEVKERVFEPFFTTKETGHGTGLGLATVHGIVKQSGGHIFAYSEAGRGTAFKIYFPPAGESIAAAPPRVEEDAPRGNETILVVEDEATLREITRECLAAAGYTVLEAAHGAAALELSDRYQGAIQLLMTDVVMPGLSGSELARRLTAERTDMKVLFMSGYTDDAVVLRGVLTKEMPFLQKPFTIAQLARTVREVLDG